MKQTRSHRTQDQRSASTQAKLLKSAIRLFGRKGYAHTSLDHIAQHAKLTIGAIYHHFGNKKKLFAAVNDAMEQEIVAALLTTDGNRSVVSNWENFLELCDDPGFRQIVLLDAPNVLGRERWSDTAVTRAVEQLAGAGSTTDQPVNYERHLQQRMMIGALAEAALFIAEAQEPLAAKQAAQKIVRKFSQLW